MTSGSDREAAVPQSLDQEESYRCDSGSRLVQLADSSELLLQGHDAARRWLDTSRLPQLERLDEVVLCSVGGGPVSALLQLRSMLMDELKVPLVLSQAYTMPAYVDRHTLVIFVNYSGGSEEVLSAYQSAVDAGAVPVVLTAGGQLAQLAETGGHSLYRLPQGRLPFAISTGHILVPLLALLHRLGLIGSPEQAVAEAAALLREGERLYGRETPEGANPAKQQALEMRGRQPAVYGTLPFTDALANRFRTQLAEHAKVTAFAGAMSSLHHDEAFGWDAASSVMERLHVTLIRDREDSARMAKRTSVTAEVLRGRGAVVAEVDTRGESRLARICSLQQQLDYTAYYLAIASAVDPSRSPTLQQFRERYNS